MAGHAILVQDRPDVSVEIDRFFAPAPSQCKRDEATRQRQYSKQVLLLAWLWSRCSRVKIHFWRARWEVPTGYQFIATLDTAPDGLFDKRPDSIMPLTRRDFGRNMALVTGAAFAPGINIIRRRRPAEEVIGHGDYRYRVHASWGDLNPETTPVKNCHEMVQDARGRLIMIGDEPKNNILIYDTGGRLLDSWGTTFPYGHGLTLWNAGGEEFLFICDNGFDGNPQVVKTTLAGREVMRLPHPASIGEYGDEERYHPTETAIAPNGDIYVADGYGSQRILQFSQDGEFIRKFGERGNDDAQFSTVHGVCVDTRDPDNPHLICTSRGHNAFKRFTLDGKYLSTVFLPGAFVCRPVIDDNTLYSGVCWSRLRYLNQTDNSGFVTILDDKDRVVSNPGGTAPEYRDGQLQLMVQDSAVFKHCHDVCVDRDKNLYVCQWNAGQTYPVKLERV